MELISQKFNLAKQAYDRNEPAIQKIHDTVLACLKKLSSLKPIRYGTCSGKHYSIFSESTQKSRPFLPSLFISNSALFQTQWNELLESASPSKNKFKLSESKVNSILYTAIMSFSICYDLWKPGSRKTPGTFFEVMLGALLSEILTTAERTKFIRLPPPKGLSSDNSADTNLQATPEPADDENGDGLSQGLVATDIVFNFPNRGIVIPAKITTRERIVQPFAHQRILDSAFGVGRFVSLLTCVSETQRDDRNACVNEICVPGTIALFQEYLSNLGGIYYLDPPARYLKLRDENLIHVGSIGELFTGGIIRHITKT